MAGKAQGKSEIESIFPPKDKLPFQFGALEVDSILGQSPGLKESIDEVDEDENRHKTKHEQSCGRHEEQSCDHPGWDNTITMDEDVVKHSRIAQKTSSSKQLNALGFAELTPADAFNAGLRLCVSVCITMLLLLLSCFIPLASLVASQQGELINPLALKRQDFGPPPPQRQNELRNHQEGFRPIPERPQAPGIDIPRFPTGGPPDFPQELGPPEPQFRQSHPEDGRLPPQLDPQFDRQHQGLRFPQQGPPRQGGGNRRNRPGNDRPGNGGGKRNGNKRNRPQQPPPLDLDYFDPVDPALDRPQRPVERPQQGQRPQQIPEYEDPEEEEKPNRLALLLEQSRFECGNKKDGYYADTELNCEVFHYCAAGVKNSWICPEGATFHQVHLICMPPGRSDDICKESDQFHFVNDYLYQPINEDDAKKYNETLVYADRYYPEGFVPGSTQDISTLIERERQKYQTGDERQRQEASPQKPRAPPHAQRQQEPPRRKQSFGPPPPQPQRFRPDQGFQEDIDYPDFNAPPRRQGVADHSPNALNPVFAPDQINIPLERRRPAGRF
ncbi:unnamed protein product [Cyprideis torosa]|uniref:Uncharacterized protein n=1 Tax=Cyprideis torosa TaxID=163714 RepID=A0A7R8W6Y4_9CRUS|nr:unnamed protein product [Cyprideis torosa]CAG0886949.1 unnamed protein product [Cyprideis torosa]